MERLRQEVFYLAYHLHWSYTTIMDMDTSERQEFVRLLSEQIEREYQAVKRSGKHHAD